MSNLKVEQGTQVAATVPLFLKKLWKMVNDENAQEIISWNSTGDGFIIHDPVAFITNLLPHYFKHNNLASFVRQLNFYDFHKVATVEKDEMQFAHSYFLKDLPETLVFITRKASSARAKASKDVTVNETDVQTLLDSVRELKGKHTLINQELHQLKEENSALWNEINCLRVKYSKQSQIINKLLHFLISYIHTHQNVYNKQNTGVGSKNIPKNINARPSLLEIGYKERQKKALILNQPRSSGSAITYNMEPATEDVNSSNMDLLNSILKATADNGLPYSVQFPNSPRDKSPTGLEVIRKRMPETITTDESQARKIVQIDKSGTLEDIFQVKDAANDKAITYSIKYPKVNCPIEAVVTPQEVTKKPKINIVGNQTIVPPRFTSTTITKKSLQPTTMANETSDVILNSNQPNIQPVSKVMKDTAMKKSGAQKKNTSRKRSIKEKSKTSVAKEQKISNEAELDVQQPSSDSLEFGLPINEFLSNPDILNILETVPEKPKKPELTIRDNPKENLTLYVDNIESEINNFQDILTNINGKEFDQFLQDLSPMKEIDAQLERNEEENYNLNLMNKDLSGALEELPSLPSLGEIQNTEADKSAEPLTDEIIFDGENPENFVNIDDYFNKDFGIE